MGKKNTKSNKTPMVMMVLGGLGTMFGLMALMIVFMQKSFLARSNAADNAPEFMLQYMEKIHQIFLVWMPLLSVLGLVWVVGGFLLHRYGRAYKGWVLISILLSVGWIFGYFYSSLSALEIIRDNISLPGGEFFFQASLLFTSLLFCTMPILAGYYLYKEYF